jgi:hypothetical protein
MPKFVRFLCAAAMAAAICIFQSPADGHGLVGQRFFPATITTDDPFAVDELGFTFSTFDLPPGDDQARTHQLDVGAEFVKEIFPKFAIGVSDDWLSQRHVGGSRVAGFDNLTLTAKYEVFRNDAHEFIVSAGLETAIGGTGSKGIGADTFSTFTPTLYFGKGFGDLPDSLGGFKPLALTGTVGQTFPTNAVANTLEWGLALEYNIPYLQQHVRDVGIPEPFRNMIPLVEFSMETGENRDARGLTTGTINPGVLWECKYCQLGIEALIPVNHDSGSHVGAIFQVQIYIDDICPKDFGHPMFGG